MKRNKEFLDMPDLLSMVKSRGEKVVICPIYENWIDIGRPETLIEAEKSWRNF